MVGCQLEVSHTEGLSHGQPQSARIVPVLQVWRPAALATTAAPLHVTCSDTPLSVVEGDNHKQHMQSTVVEQLNAEYNVIWYRQLKLGALATVAVCSYSTIAAK